VIIFGFSVAFYVGFFNSEGVKEFGSLESALFTLFFMIARGVEIGPLFESTHWLPEFIFYAYLIIIYFILLSMFMAIILDAYTLITYGRYAGLNKQFAQDSILWCFLISYYSKLKGEQYINPDELDEDRGKLDEQFIDCDYLPEILQRVWEVKRAQIKSLVDSKAEQMGNNEEILKLKKEFEDFDTKGVISRIQIQRLLDEDEELAKILGTDKAIDVIRRFSLPEFINTEARAFDEIQRLQENVFTKLEEFEHLDSNLEFGCIESLKLVSTGLHEALSDIQNQWRTELTAVLETTNNLASTLNQMTKKLEVTQMNHSAIVHEAGLQQIVNNDGGGGPAGAASGGGGTTSS